MSDDVVEPLDRAGIDFLRWHLTTDSSKLGYDRTYVAQLIATLDRHEEIVPGSLAGHPSRWPSERVIAAERRARKFELMAAEVAQTCLDVVEGEARMYSGEYGDRNTEVVSALRLCRESIERRMGFAAGRGAGYSASEDVAEFMRILSTAVHDRPYLPHPKITVASDGEWCLTWQSATGHVAFFTFDGDRRAGYTTRTPDGPFVAGRDFWVTDTGVGDWVLAALEPHLFQGKEEAVDRIAQAMWREESLRAAGRGRKIPWSEENDHVRDRWRALARVALELVPPSTEVSS